MNKLYRFYWDAGRLGDLEGLFVAREEDVAKLMNSEIQFGEVLGKHSDIGGTLEDKDLTIKSEDQDFINKLVEVMGSYNISGLNPLEYVYEEEIEDEDEEYYENDT